MPFWMRLSPMCFFSNEIPDFWIHSLFDLKRTTNPIHRSVVPSMYRAILKETVCASITKNGEIIATGLGILDRDYIGIYAIHVREDYRRRGYARQICTGLLNEGKKRGASHAYLQVGKKQYFRRKALQLSWISVFLYLLVPCSACRNTFSVNAWIFRKSL